MQNRRIYAAKLQRLLAAVVIGALAVDIATPALADPPPWAPAHGKRKKEAPPPAIVYGEPPPLYVPAPRPRAVYPAPDASVTITVPLR
jgi:hypothetical protein